MPYYLDISNTLSDYLHYFFPLLFVGNYRKAPSIITLMCALLNLYDLVLRIFDVRTTQNTLCKDYKNTSSGGALFITFQARYQLFASCLCIYGWLVCLCVKHENRYKFGLFYHLGSLLKSLFVSIFFCKKCEMRKKIIQEPYAYPHRVIFSGVFAFWLAVINVTFVKDI